MWLSDFFARLPLALLALAHGAQSGRGKLFVDSKNVYELDTSRVENEVATSKSPWVVMYYADWCPHCHFYAPTFERIAQQIAPLHRGPVDFGALNCPDFLAFCTKIQISGYPTIRTYHFKGDVGNALSGSRPDRSMVHNEQQFLAWLQHNAPGENATAPEAVAPEPADQETTNQPKVGVRGAQQVPVSPAPSRSKVLQEAMPALHMADAEVAILYSLRQGAFLRGEAGLLQGPPLAELMSWMDFLARTIPGGGHRSVALLSDAIHEVVASDEKLSTEAFENLMESKGLDRIPPQAALKPDAFWRHCQGFTCGLWTLFHLLSQAARVTSSTSSASSVRGEELLLRIRGFVDNFFGCSYCREHFLEAFDGCKFDRCTLAKDDIDGAALWLWKMHNDVTLRVAKEKGREMPKPWPLLEDCEECWICQDCWKSSRSDEDFNRAAMLAHLRREYLSPEWQEQGGDLWLADWSALPRALPLAVVAALLMAVAALRLRSSALGDTARGGKDAKKS